MPPSIGPIILAAILLLCSVTRLSAQEGSSDSTEQDSACHTISFSLGDYDVISSIYVFLSAGNQAPSCRLEVLSIRKRAGLGWLLPSALSLDLLFKEAIGRHYELGHLPCDGTSGEFPVQATLENPGGLSSILFTLFSLLHLDDKWNYSVEEEDGEILISFIDFLDDFLVE